MRLINVGFDRRPEQVLRWDVIASCGRWGRYRTWRYRTWWWAVIVRAIGARYAEIANLEIAS